MPTNAMDTPRRTHNDAKVGDVVEAKVGHDDDADGLHADFLSSPADIHTAPSQDQVEAVRDKLAEQNVADPAEAGWTAQSGEPYLGRESVPEPWIEEHELPANTAWAARVSPAIVVGTDEAKGYEEAKARRAERVSGGDKKAAAKRTRATASKAEHKV